MDETIWRRPSACEPHGLCVEVGRTVDHVLLRNSREGQTGRGFVLPPTSFTVDEMRIFIDAVKAGEFDDLIEP